MNYQNKKLATLLTPDRALKLKTDITHQTIWSSLNQISQLFGRDKSVIFRYIATILKKMNQTRVQLLQKIQELLWLEKFTAKEK